MLLYQNSSDRQKDDLIRERLKCGNLPIKAKLLIMHAFVKIRPFYCINICLVWSCSVSINSCKSKSVKLLQEATLKVTNGPNSCTGWANAVLNINRNKRQYCIHQQRKRSPPLIYNNFSGPGLINEWISEMRKHMHVSNTFNFIFTL